MLQNKLNALVAGAVCSMFLTVVPSASAVGNGIPFVFREGLVPGGMAHPVDANSLDFTYRACVGIIDPDTIIEGGYLWVSSFQRAGTVVDSQINYFLANGYHLYARYRLQAEECSEQKTCDGLQRRNFFVTEGSLSLYLDPLQDTLLSLPNCGGVAAAGFADDLYLGSASAIESGQKSETNDQANGDFDVVFSNWVFTPAGQALFKDGMGNPLAAPRLVFDGNVTLLGAPLTSDHRVEGSGNLYWRN